MLNNRRISKAVSNDIKYIVSIKSIRGAHITILIYQNDGTSYAYA